MTSRFEAELTALALRLASVHEPEALAFEVVSLLLAMLRMSRSPAWHVETHEALRDLYDAAVDAVTAPPEVRDERMSDVRYEADRMASRLFSRVGERGAWPLELQLPYDIATALRRSCEPDIRRMLPLIVRDARALLTLGARADTPNDETRKT